MDSSESLAVVEGRLYGEEADEQRSLSHWKNTGAVTQP